MLSQLATLFPEEQLDIHTIRQSEFSLNTRKGYANDWKLFCSWCSAVGRESLPATAETITLHLIDLLRRGRKISTAERHVSAIAYHHRNAGHEFEAVAKEAHEILDLAKRYRPEQPRQMAPLLVNDLRKIARRLVRDGSVRALRDRAVLVVGIGSALRRCNLAALSLADVAFTPKGLEIRVRKEKNDQTGRGRLIGLPLGRHSETCPVRSLRAWLRVRGGEAGPLFTWPESLHAISGPEVGRIVKRAVEMIGLDPTLYAGHSLRAGFVTAAGESGASELVIAAQTGHRSMAVLRRYFRHQDVWRSNACGMIGL
jgi:site-specific recombinase XerD